MKQVMIGLCGLWLVLGAVPLSAELSTNQIVFPPHPRLSYTSRELEAWKADPARQVELQQVITRANAILAKGLTVPEKEGDWIFYYACPKEGTRLRPETPERHVCPACKQVYTDERTQASYRTLLNDQLNGDCRALALAYALTGETRYAEPVAAALLKLARLYPTWTRHDRWKRRGLLAVVGGRRYAQLLDEAFAAIELSKAYDLVYHAISEPDRKLIETGCLGDPVREIARYQFFAGSRNNHQTWFNAAYVATGLAIGDEPLMRDGIEGSHGMIWQLKESVTRDGLWYEGALAYQRYAMQALLVTLEAAKRVGWDFSQDTRLKSLWYGPINLAYPNGQLPVFHDSDPASLDGWKEMFRWGHDYFQDPVLGAYGGSSGGTNKLVLRSTDLAGQGIAVLRGGTESNPICVMMDYGLHGDQHGHPDKLNIVLFALGRELVLDPGRLTYSVPEYETWARTTVAHNTVVVDERNQEPDTGTLVYFDDKPGFAAAYAVSRGAFPGVVLKRFLVLRGELLIDVFSVEGQGKPQIDWVLHGIGGVTATPALTERTAPLGKSNGYQFLIALREGKGRESSYTFTIPGGKPHQVYCVDSQVATHVTGQGIGYSLRERTPFVMRRQMDRNAVFVTVHDLSGQERRLKVEAQFQGGTGRVPGADVQVKVHYGPTERVAFDFRANASNAVEITTF